MIISDGDEASDSSDGSFHPNENERDEKKEVQKLFRWDTYGLRCSRIVVLLFLLITGATVSTLAFLFFQGEGTDDFSENFHNFAQHIRITTQHRMENMKLAFVDMAESITTSAASTNSRFPFVTMPLFEAAAEQARLMSGAESFVYSPIVSSRQKELWEKYALGNQGWIEQSRDIYRSSDFGIPTVFQEGNITPMVWQLDVLNNPVPAFPPPFAPTWQVSPPPFTPQMINYNMFAEDHVAILFHSILVLRESLVSMVVDQSQQHLRNEMISQSLAASVSDFNATTAYPPLSILAQPVFNTIKDDTSAVVGLVLARIPWNNMLKGLLPEGIEGMYAVLRNSCGQTYTYKLRGMTAEYLGEGEREREKWRTDMETHFPLVPNLSNETAQEEGHCMYSYSLYASDELQQEWETALPIVFSCAAAAIFLSVAIIFFVYDGFVRRQNAKVVEVAARSNKIVASFFPQAVRDRLIASNEAERAAKSRPGIQGTQSRLKNFLANDGPSALDLEETDDQLMWKTQPIAELYPEATILFADIAGFTAWSSAREPSQVFTLLETVYHAFDEIAQRRRVFKVETIGDCYVAACGLPEARKDHAVAMARFAKDCMHKMQSLTKKLEVSLGPDTCDLTMRMGIHSGPVTAGVLRGERSRFQLFGDTMNHAAKMESAGQRDRIQVSKDTAELLRKAGKENWITPRGEADVAKEKVDFETFWLQLNPNDANSGRKGSVSFGDSSSGNESTVGGDGSEPDAVEAAMSNAFSPKITRMIDWNADLLGRLLKSVAARRMARPANDFAAPDEWNIRQPGKTVLDEVQEHIALPAYDQTLSREEIDPDSVTLGAEVEQQLRDYVSAIASMYKANPFHNFEHASHVTMSVAKLLSRIVAPSNLDFDSSQTRNETLHDHTYGITSDPLTQFACVLSALIHDVDHTGVPNTQLAVENPGQASYYHNRSVAEQNSVDLAWNLLMQDIFSELRAAIYSTDEELVRFRQLVVNSVMATDIMDKELKALRNARWEKTFSEHATTENAQVTVNRKATIVIEHLLQASDVAHTMQHWHIYHKWNQRLFREMNQAYKDGRSDKNPADFWYSGEIGFFDFYIIPLAKKLKECGVFGVSSDEYFNYATRNRAEWESRGKELVAQYVLEAEGDNGEKDGA